MTHSLLRQKKTSQGCQIYIGAYVNPLAPLFLTDLEGHPEEEHRRALPGHPVDQEARGDDEEEAEDEPRGREVLSAQDEQGREGRAPGEVAQGRQDGADHETSILIARPHCPQITLTHTKIDESR